MVTVDCSASSAISALLPGAEMFTKYDRAAGAFQDPNVFGPFLTLPGIYLLYRLLTGSPARMSLYAVPLLIIVAGIFFSFSRGAWGLFGASAMLLTGALFLQSTSGTFRLRIVVMSIAAVALLVVACWSCCCRFPASPTC